MVQASAYGLRNTGEHATIGLAVDSDAGEGDAPKQLVPTDFAATAHLGCMPAEDCAQSRDVLNLNVSSVKRLPGSRHRHMATVDIPAGFHGQVRVSLRQDGATCATTCCSAQLLTPPQHGHK